MPRLLPGKGERSATYNQAPPPRASAQLKLSTGLPRKGVGNRNVSQIDAGCSRLFCCATGREEPRWRKTCLTKWRTPGVNQ